MGLEIAPGQADGGRNAGSSRLGLPAAEFGIHRLTVSAHLRRAKIPIRRGGLSQNQAAETAALYEAGWSYGRLAEKLSASTDTVLKALRTASVDIRPRRRGPKGTDRRP